MAIPRPNLPAAVSPSLVPPQPWFLLEVKVAFWGSVSVWSGMGECDCVPRYLNCCILRKCRRAVSTNILLLASLIASRVCFYVHCIHLKGFVIIATWSEGLFISLHSKNARVKLSRIFSRNSQSACYPSFWIRCDAKRGKIVAQWPILSELLRLLL